LVLAPIPETGTEPDAIHAFLDEVERARATHERQRLLYVACTRAQERLHLVGVARRAEDGIKPPQDGTLLGALWPALEGEFAEREAAVLIPPSVAPGAPGTPSLTGERLPANWTLPAIPPALATSADSALVPVEERIVYDWAGATARLVGNAVHGLLQRIAQAGFAAWPEAEPQQRALAQRLLVQAGLFGELLKPAVDQVLAAIRTALADPKGQWVLGPRQDARVEWELTVREGARSRRIKLDRTFLDEQGVRWVVDYKTGSHTGGDLDHFLDEEQERYRSQLERYAQALVKLDPFTPVKCGLYFPLAVSPDGSGGWREWSFSTLAAAPKGTPQ
jgi:ATP-dependent exoDNAse (exonuclease V) beta subunit